METLNKKERPWKNPKYLSWIRALPSCISGEMGCQAHHVSVIGRKGIQNDHYAIPVTAKEHCHKGEITRQYIEDQNGEDPRDLIIFYLSLYIEELQGRYNKEVDMEHKFTVLRTKKDGFIYGENKLS